MQYDEFLESSSCNFFDDIGPVSYRMNVSGKVGYREGILRRGTHGRRRGRAACIRNYAVSLVRNWGTKAWQLCKQMGKGAGELSELRSL